MSQHQAPNCILAGEVRHQSCSINGSIEPIYKLQARLNEIVHRNETNRRVYSLDVQQTIRINRF